MAQAAQEELTDLSSRVEYAFYSGDPPALRQALTSLEKLSVSSAQRDLQLNDLNYGRWKLAQLLAATNADEAGRSADSCVAAMPSKPSAEQAALTAACLTLLEELRSLRSLWYRNEREQRIKQATALDAKNLQVQFVAAWIKAEREPDAAETYVAVKNVVAAFSDASGRLHEAEWGYAEAWYLLGKMEFARHDVLAARNALERATLITPDYREAQALLKKLTAAIPGT